jgi:hypothetical protein
VGSSWRRRSDGMARACRKHQWSGGI